MVINVASEDSFIIFRSFQIGGPLFWVRAKLSLEALFITYIYFSFVVHFKKTDENVHNSQSTFPEGHYHQHLHRSTVTAELIKYVMILTLICPHWASQQSKQNLSLLPQYNHQPSLPTWQNLIWQTGLCPKSRHTHLHWKRPLACDFLMACHRLASEERQNQMGPQEQARFWHAARREHVLGHSVLVDTDWPAEQCGSPSHTEGMITGHG